MGKTSEGFVSGYGVTSGTSDTTKPAAIVDLSASDPTPFSITLTWTSPGDDGNTGTAASYDIRYSTSTITGTDWRLATKVSGEPSPLIAGSSQSMIVSGLLPDTAYYFAVKTADEAKNISKLSNVAAARRRCFQDHQVNMQDIQACADVILARQTDFEIVQRAKEVAVPLDVCNIADVQAIVNIILGK